MAEDLVFRPASVRLSLGQDGMPICPHCGLSMVATGPTSVGCPIMKANSDALEIEIDRLIVQEFPHG